MRAKTKKKIIMSLLTAKILSSILIITPETSRGKAIDIVDNHKGKLCIEYFYSYADDSGLHGYTKDGFYTCYNKKVKPGKKVLTITILNPSNNYEDDYIAIYDNGIWR